MVKLEEIENFTEAIEEAALNTERKKQMKNVTLTENEKTRIAEWIGDCKNLASARRLTGFSENYLSSLKNKHRDVVRGATYEIFQNILKPEPSPNAEAEKEAKEAKGIGKGSYVCSVCHAEYHAEWDSTLSPNCCGIPMMEMDVPLKSDDVVAEECKMEMSEFQVMGKIDEYISLLSADKEAQERVADYFADKYGSPKSDAVFVINDSGIHKLER
jgi:hypothetical protein